MQVIGRLGAGADVLAAAATVSEYRSWPTPEAAPVLGEWVPAVGGGEWEF
jgi:hypothetical protein